jgi:hypothetical protein
MGTTGLRDEGYRRFFNWTQFKMKLEVWNSVEVRPETSELANKVATVRPTRKSGWASRPSRTEPMNEALHQNGTFASVGCRGSGYSSEAVRKGIREEMRSNEILLVTSITKTSVQSNHRAHDHMSDQAACHSKMAGAFPGTNPTSKTETPSIKKNYNDITIIR